MHGPCYTADLLDFSPKDQRRGLKSAKPVRLVDMCHVRFGSARGTPLEIHHTNKSANAARKRGLLPIRYAIVEVAALLETDFGPANRDMCSV